MTMAEARSAAAQREESLITVQTQLNEASYPQNGLARKPRFLHPHLKQRKTCARA